MKTTALCIFTFCALLVLQGCAVNVIVAPNAVFTGGDAHGDSIESQNNGHVSNVVATIPAYEE